MKVRITPRGVTVLDEIETRISGAVSDVEIVFPNGDVHTHSWREDIPSTQRKMVRDPLFHHIYGVESTETD